MKNFNYKNVLSFRKIKITMPLSDLECQNIDDEKKLANVNDVINCLEIGSLVGFPSDSASPSDICIVKFNPGTRMYGLNLSKGFLKYYVTDTSGIPIQYNNEIKALKYESIIYRMIKRLITSGVNGHFVKVLGGADSISFNKMATFLSVYSGMPQSDIDRNLYRNTNFMSFASGKARPAITNNKIMVPMPLTEAEVHNFEYAFVLTEGLTIEKLAYNPPKDEHEVMGMLESFYDLSLGSCMRFHDMNTINIYFQKILGFHAHPSLEVAENIFHTYYLSILFQACTACYSMFINNIAHNDLHSGNVLVRKIPYTLITYNVPATGKTYFVFAHFFAKIFDWDRSFCSDVARNPALNSATMFKANQTNDLIEQRDFMKLMCYVYKSFYVTTTTGYQLTNIHFTKKLMNAVVKLKPTGMDFNPARYNIATKNSEVDWWQHFKRSTIPHLGNDDTIEFQDFWEQIFIRNRQCLLNSDFIDGISPDIFKTTLYTLPEIMENLYNMQDEGGNYYIERDPDPNYGVYQNVTYTMKKI